MAARRFLLIWLSFGVLYLALAALGPSGLLQTGIWPQVNQHVVQVWAWLGRDIALPASDTGGPAAVEVSPRLDVTPYFEYWVVDDPRERVLLGNLAVGVRTEEGLEPVDYVAPESAAGRRQLQGIVCYIGSPLGPAFLLLPLQVVLGSALATQWLGALLGGLAVALIDLLLAWWLEEMRGPDLERTRTRANLLALAGLGTLWIWLTPQGEVWMFAQTTATCALTLALVLAWRRRWLVAGLAFALAITSRPPILLALPLFAVILLHRTERQRWVVRHARWRAALLAAVFPLVLGAGHLALNAARFGSPLESGYRYMLTPPELRQRLEDHGAFSPAYFARNFRYLFLEPPMAVRSPSGEPRFPYLVSDPRGMGVFFTTPAFLAVFLTLVRRWRTPHLLGACWLSLIGVALPSLMYFNTGWVQWGGRYLLDAWPLWLMVTALGLHRVHGWVAAGLVWLSVISNLWAAGLAATGWWPIR